MATEQVQPPLTPIRTSETLPYVGGRSTLVLAFVSAFSVFHFFFVSRGHDGLCWMILEFYKEFCNSSIMVEEQASSNSSTTHVLRSSSACFVFGLCSPQGSTSEQSAVFGRHSDRTHRHQPTDPLGQPAQSISACCGAPRMACWTCRSRAPRSSSPCPCTTLGIGGGRPPAGSGGGRFGVVGHGGWGGGPCSVVFLKAIS